MESQFFYNKVPIITDFKKVAEGNLYKSAPDDWWVVVGDIRNSTEAISTGQYREVNMAGAAIITAVSNIYKKMGHLPFTFGGDGAFVLVPNLHLEQVRKALLFCRNAIKDSFNLDMRVGLIQIKEIRASGHDVKVAKLKLSPYMNQALFWGDGFSYAESIIKNKKIKEEEGLHYSADLDGLECRWQEIVPSDDEITSYIIKAKSKNDKEKSAVYAACLQKIEDVYGSIKDRNPVPIDKLNLTKNWEKLQAEWKIRTWKSTLMRKVLYRMKLLYEAFMGEFVMNKAITMRGIKWGEYKSDFLNHVDFRKFEEGLRFVASGTAEEKALLEDYLYRQYEEGHLNFGIHSSNSLIITCYITNHEKEHIHFVDGKDGGYAMASKKMKKQMLKSV